MNFDKNSFYCGWKKCLTYMRNFSDSDIMANYVFTDFQSTLCINYSTRIIEVNNHSTESVCFSFHFYVNH
jgi:hypothetical protein